MESDAARAQAFAERMGIDGPALLDKFEQVAKTYGVAGEKTQLPRTFLIDVSGKVRAIDSVEGDDLEELIPSRPGGDQTALTSGRTPARLPRERDFVDFSARRRRGAKQATELATNSVSAEASSWVWGT